MGLRSVRYQIMKISSYSIQHKRIISIGYTYTVLFKLIGSLGLFHVQGLCMRFKHPYSVEN